jgi:tetraacyldisaccharide 4'-kinase
LKQRDWHRIVSGSRTGFAAALVRSLLGIAACAYSFIIYIRNFLYSRNLLKSYAATQAGLKTTDRTQASVPVISIGNITVGGTGKTPMVIWLCNFLRTKDINCAILTRGYKASAGGRSDEPAILIKNCPNTAVVINPDRLAGALEAVKRHHAQVLIMDDGFQHRRLHRDIDIVTIDATLPFGYNRVLPAGLLREPISALKRAHAAILTRCDLVSKDDLTKLTETISGINPNMAVAQTIHAPVCVRTNDKGEIPLAKLKAKKVFAFCGIANPDAFLSTISSLGAKLVGTKIFNDHHDYTTKDISDICREATQSGAEMILTTEKDYNKAGPSPGSPGLVLAYLAVKLQFLSGHEQLTQLIEQSLTGKISRKRTV